MARTDVSDPKALKPAVEKYLDNFPGELICGLQLWYQGLGGQGVPNAEEMAALQDAIAGTSGWADVGVMRYEIFGMQRSYKRAEKKEPYADGRMMAQHMFKKDGFYKEPDGTLLKVVVSEVWNLRCFEIVNGKMTGPMIKIHPESDRAKAMVEA
jgi:hypothetical protein